MSFPFRLRRAYGSDTFHLRLNRTRVILRMEYRI